MKKTLLPGIPAGMPQELRSFLSGAAVYDSSSSPEAKVCFIDKGHGYYLKASGKGTLEKALEFSAGGGNIQRLKILRVTDLTMDSGHWKPIRPAIVPVMLLWKRWMWTVFSIEWTPPNRQRGSSVRGCAGGRGALAFRRSECYRCSRRKAVVPD